MAFTTEQLDALERAIASGSLVVKYGDKSRTYRSLDDLMKLRGMMRSALGLTGSDGVPNQVRPVNRSGF